MVRDSENGLEVEGRKGVTGGRGWEPGGHTGEERLFIGTGVGSGWRHLRGGLEGAREGGEGDSGE